MSKFKKAIVNWLGLDYVFLKLNNVSDDLYNKNWEEEITSCLDYRQLERELDYGRFGIDASDIAEEFSNSDIADEIDARDIASDIDMYDLAGNVDIGDLACHMDTDDIARSIEVSEVASYFNYDKLQQHMTDAIDMDTLAQTVSEKIADRDGMHQLISEEVDAQNVSGVSTDAVQAMIDTAIQQFADSLEIMVSAKLNINK